MDDEHVLTLIEAVDGTYLDTVHVLTFDAALVDDVRHLSLLPGRLAVDLRIIEWCTRLTINSLGVRARWVTRVTASIRSSHIHDRGSRLVSLGL
jgi:hypothetical protein